MCQMCGKKEATCKITYGVLELHKIKVCDSCRQRLWRGEGTQQSLHALVTAGCCYFLIEKV